MKKGLTIFLVTMVCSVIAGCSSSNNPTSVNGMTGVIYYSSARNINRIQLSDQTSSELFTNAQHPDITANGEILCGEAYPNDRIIYSDATGANRKSIIESESYKEPIHKYYLEHPRISYNQKYIVYDGGSIHNPNTYVIDAVTGSLMATIGNYMGLQSPLISPSWSPDGSIFVQGWISLNNGIYKVSPDFLTIERIDPNLSNVSESSVSPDGKTIAFIS
jgi:Tol biopolymer transport system component